MSAPVIWMAVKSSGEAGAPFGGAATLTTGHTPVTPSIDRTIFLMSEGEASIEKPFHRVSNSRRSRNRTPSARALLRNASRSDRRRCRSVPSAAGALPSCTNHRFGTPSAASTGMRLASVGAARACPAPASVVAAATDNISDSGFQFMISPSDSLSANVPGFMDGHVLQCPASCRFVAVWGQPSVLDFFSRVCGTLPRVRRCGNTCGSR